MKISKKIFLAAITAAAVAFVGCGMSEGDLDGKGSKWERTIKKDSTTVGVEEASPAYGRAFSQLGTGEKVQSIKTLVTVYTDGIDGLVVDQGDKYYLQAPEGAQAGDKVDGKEVSAVHGVVGFLFDLHKTKAKADAADGKSYKAGDTLYDFVIVGYRSSDKGFYVEKYKNVAEGSMDAYVTTTSFAASKDDVMYAATHYRNGVIPNESAIKATIDYTSYKAVQERALPKFKYYAQMMVDLRKTLEEEIKPLTTH